MQNYRMIDEMRQSIQPLVSQVTEGVQVDERQHAASDLLNVAVNIRRGNLCKLAAGQICGVCADLTIKAPICTWMVAQGVYTPSTEPSFTARNFIADV